MNNEHDQELILYFGIVCIFILLSIQSQSEFQMERASDSVLREVVVLHDEKGAGGMMEIDQKRKKSPNKDVVPSAPTSDSLPSKCFPHCDCSPTFRTSHFTDLNYNYDGQPRAVMNTGIFIIEDAQGLFRTEDGPSLNYWS